MASTGAVVYIRPRSSVTTVAARTTGAVVYVPFRGVSGLFTGGVTSSIDSANKRIPMPYANVPLATIRDGNAYINPAWDRFFRYWWEQKQGGINAPTLSDVVTTVDASVATSAAVEGRVASSTAMAIANAAALDAAVQVLQNNAIPGASQIPNRKLAPDEWPI